MASLSREPFATSLQLRWRQRVCIEQGSGSAGPIWRPRVRQSGDWSLCSNQLVARAWLGTIDVLRSLETLREFSHTSLPAFSVDLGVQNFRVGSRRRSLTTTYYRRRTEEILQQVPDLGREPTRFRQNATKEQLALSQPR